MPQTTPLSLFCFYLICAEWPMSFPMDFLT
ncbi:MAG: GhoT/OrtT family toxin [Thermoplasmata archaeon]|nr:GhoT/OrtT family toxin [Thermoplasmata archaeon]